MGDGAQYDFIALDVETADGYYTSAHAIALAYVAAMEVLEAQMLLFKPPAAKLSRRNTRIHRLRARDLQEAPTFRQLWFGLRGKLAGEALAIYDSHQVQILKALFEDYSIPWPSFNYMLVLDMVRKYLPALPDYGLPTVARYLNIFVIASEPTSRAMACGDILLAWNNGSIQSRKPVRPTLRLRVDGDGDG